MSVPRGTHLTFLESWSQWKKRHTQQEGENVPRGTLRQIIRENLSIHGTRALRVRELEAGCLSDPNLWVVFHVEHYVQFSPALLQTSAVFRVERCVSLTSCC